MRGGGRGLGSGLFSQAGCDNHGEAGVPSGRCEVRLKKKNGVKAFGPGTGL